jgi:ABC-type nitrate/sulfonate/bicarbonate transport system substrate-binding protein
MSLSRRTLLAAPLLAPLAAPLLPRRAHADDIVVKMGALKLIHSITPYFYERFAPAGMKIEVIPFENPADCNSAVATKSIDFGTFGIAAGILGAVAHQPIVVVASACNKGMAVVARKDSDIATLKDLKGKRVAIWPGSTQEVFILERLRMEGMSVRDLTPVRVSFSEMNAALARGDVDAYVGAEPAPGVSISTGVGKIVEYPYSTPMGSLNMIIATHRDTVTGNPALVTTMVDIQRKASDFAMSHPDEMVAMTVAKLGQKRDAIAISVPNVELNWRMTPEMIAETKIYAQQMLELKQIRALPDFSTFLDPAFSDAVAKTA